MQARLIPSSFFERVLLSATSSSAPISTRVSTALAEAAPSRTCGSRTSVKMPSPSYVPHKLLDNGVGLTQSVEGGCCRHNHQHHWRGCFPRCGQGHPAQRLRSCQHQGRESKINSLILPKLTNPVLRRGLRQGLPCLWNRKYPQLSKLRTVF